MADYTKLVDEFAARYIPAILVWTVEELRSKLPELVFEPDSRERGTRIAYRGVDSEGMPFESSQVFKNEVSVGWIRDVITSPVDGGFILRIRPIVFGSLGGLSFGHRNGIDWEDILFEKMGVITIIEIPMPQEIEALYHEVEVAEDEEFERRLAWYKSYCKELGIGFQWKDWGEEIRKGLWTLNK